MDGDWDEVGRIAFPVPGAPDYPRPASTIAFDTSYELLWVGSEGGRVTSLYGTELQRYTSYRSHPQADGPVRQFLFHDKGVISLGPRSVHMSMRRGPTLWDIRHENMVDLRCMSFTSKGTAEILVAGAQDVMFVIDVHKGEITRQITADNPYIIMRKSRYICAATKTGSVDLIDPLTLKVVKNWQAHVAYIHDMDAQNDFIVTCGGSLKNQSAQAYMLDPYVNVFDLKNMTSMNPIPFPPLAAYVRMHPRMLTTSIVVSQQGQMHVVDLMNPNTSNVRYANVLSILNMVEIAGSGEALALVDTECNIHLWGSPSKIHFADFSQHVEFADPVQAPPDMDWEAPFSTIGLPFYRDTLLSAWPANLISDVGAPPVQLDPSFLATLNKAEWGLYGRNTRGTLRHQVQDTRKNGKAANAMKAPKFLSEKARELMVSGLNPPAEITQASDTLLSKTDLPSLKPEAPAMYQNLEIKYSKFGVDDFDFRYYNNTKYAGLENHIVNSYANSLIQVMHYTPLLRNLALQHAATACLAAPCLLCELGYVFDMLQKAEGSTCQATNMLKALSSSPQAGPLGLLEEENRTLSLTMMAQSLSRYLLDRIKEDYRSILPASTALEQEIFGLPESPKPDEILNRLLATPAVVSIRCMNCRNESTRPGTTHVVDMMYPVHKLVGRVKMPVARTTFSQVLMSSVERETTTKGWCSRCQRYQTLQTRKTTHSAPAVLTINTAVSSPDHRRFWATPGWLPEEIGIIVDGGQFFCYEEEALRFHLQRGAHNIAVYSLVGMVVNVDGGQPQSPHLVSMVNVSHSEPTAPGESRWHLFNDFSVQPVSTAEALTFNASWKMPSVLVYQLKAANNKSNKDWRARLDTSVLYKDISPPLHHERTYQLLHPETEIPGPDTIVALDTEFVSLKQPEIQMNSDGERETIRPMAHALARVSVVRGQGELEGVPFIDDYIAIKEPIVDYLTLYSGITPGDLDPRTSPHNLVALKIAYKKLWVLLNLGCKFLGHGLKQDFRVINIQIPKTQVIDTIELFYLKSRLRRLSLAFLAWYLLKEDIQLETHDSIEDARTALKLYRKFLEFDDAGILEPMLQDIYKAGRETNFKPQRKEDLIVQRTDTPPISLEPPTTPARKTGIAPGQTLGSGGFALPTWTPGKSSPLKDLKD